MENKNLGRGLSAIFNDLQQQNSLESDIVAIEILTKLISTNPQQPRKFFDEKKMDELIDSIKKEGILQPILVRKVMNGDSDTMYQIVAGERRWRAVVSLNIPKIPAIILECNDQTALQLGLIENLQRDNLSIIEEAVTIRALIENFEKTQEEIADMICKSRSYVTNTLRLLKLPTTVQEMLQKRQITPGHARAILESNDPEIFAKRIVEENLTVRDIESMVQFEKRKIPIVGKAPQILTKDFNISEKKIINENILKENQDLLLLEQKISEYLEARIKILPKGNGGVIQIYFHDYNFFDKIIAKITSNIFG
ncbi:MAG: ParB/RepB/Spo0J family partition protein [Holosporales bacterium]|jgi:ParB family chromosome partitioning protein|nr:ParB/RepB/Spo0J family partition protein [Holosporales bacterium]